MIFDIGTLRAMPEASAPSATIHLPSGLTPHSSSSVESRTPVQSEQQIWPWMRCTPALIGSRW